MVVFHKLYDIVFFAETKDFVEGLFVALKDKSYLPAKAPTPPPQPVKTEEKSAAPEPSYEPTPISTSVKHEENTSLQIPRLMDQVPSKPSSIDGRRRSRTPPARPTRGHSSERERSPARSVGKWDLGTFSWRHFKAFSLLSVQIGH